MDGAGSGRSISKRPASRREFLRLTGLAAGGTAAALLTRSAFGQTGPTGPSPQPALVAVAEDVYEFSFGGYNTIFIPTSEGVIAADPIGLNNAATPAQFKAAIESITDQPVKYVVYSHDHADHITGSAVFADTAQFISQALAAPKIAALNDARTPPPTITFADHMTLTLGGKTIELYYAGRNASDNQVLLLYPARRLLFAVDFIPVNALPFRDFPDSYPDEWVDSLQWVEDHLDFDVLVPGHGPLGTKDTVRQDREYLLAIMAAIRSARAQGLTDNSPEMLAVVRDELMPMYGGWQNFNDWLPLNIAGLTRLGFSR